MAHNARRNIDAVYGPKYVATGADFQFFDANITKALNGDGGGTWNPAAALTIGGAGTALGLAASLTGGTHVLALGAGSAVQHGDSDYLLLSVSRTLASPVLGGVAPRATSNPYFWHRDGVLAVSGPVRGASSTFLLDELAPWTFPLRVHNAGRMTSVAFKMSLGDVHAEQFQYPIRVRVLRVDQNGAESPIGTAADANGFVAFSGNYGVTTEQDIVYACNETIDTSRYSYRAEIRNEYGNGDSGVANPNLFYGAVATIATTTMVPQ